jgi:hypothetical protein
LGRVRPGDPYPRPPADRLAIRYEAPDGRPAHRLQVYGLGQHGCADHECRERYDGYGAEYGSQYRVAEQDYNDC